MTEEKQVFDEMLKAMSDRVDKAIFGMYGATYTNAAPDKPLTKEELMQSIVRAQRLMRPQCTVAAEKGAAKFTNLVGGGSCGLSGLAGFNLISSVHMTDHIRKRVHRKRRIDKKWLKRYGYREVPKKDLIRAGNTLYGHPLTIQRVKHLLANGVTP